MEGDFTGTTYHLAQVDGLQLFYRLAGPVDAPVLVLLHGFLSSSRMYEPLLRLLARKYRLIAPDYPGFGHSSNPPPDTFEYTFDRLAASVRGLLRVLGIERYSLFVQDYGGPVGYRLAMLESDRLAGLIVQNANAYAEGLGPKWAGLAQFWEDPVGHADEFDRFISLEAARQRHIGNSPHPERYDPDLWTDEGRWLAQPEQRAIQRALLFDYRTNVRSYPEWQAWLRARRPPTLVLWGRYDPSFLVSGAFAFRRDVPDAKIHVLEAGHFALDEAATEVAFLVEDFLERYREPRC